MPNRATLPYVALTYKVCTLLVGILCIYFGFRLFQEGVFGASGDLSVAAGKSRLNLKDAAPGTLFALFGSVVIGFTVYRGLRLEDSESKSQSKADGTSARSGQNFANQLLTSLDALEKAHHLTRKQAAKVRAEIIRIIGENAPPSASALTFTSISVAAAASAPIPAAHPSAAGPAAMPAATPLPPPAAP